MQHGQEIREVPCKVLFQKTCEKKNHVGAPRRRWLANIQYGLRSVLCVISSFRREADENRTLLGHYSGLTETHATVSNAFLCPSWQASGVGSCGHGNEA